MDTAVKWSGLKLQDDVIPSYGDIISSDDLAMSPQVPYHAVMYVTQGGCLVQQFTVL